MKKTKFDVKLPKEEVIQEQISIILAKGLPKRKTFVETINEIWDNMPLWHVVFGRGEWIFSLILLIGGLALTIFTLGNYSIKEIEFYSSIFTGAPFLFLALTGYSYLDKKINGTLEVEMTTKFTVYQMLAIRMFIYSALASFFIITCIVVAALFIEINLLYSISIALSGLFIFAALFLLIYKEQHVYIQTIIFCMVWIGGNMGLYHGLTNSYELIITQLPVLIYFLILLSAISLYIYSLKRIFTRKQGGAFECLS